MTAQEIRNLVSVQHDFKTLVNNPHYYFTHFEACQDWLPISSNGTLKNAILSGRHGVVALGTGTTTTARSGLGRVNSIANPPGSIIFGTGVVDFTALVQIPILSNTTDEFKAFAGFSSNFSTPDTGNGFGFIYNRASNGDFWSCTNSNGIKTETVTSVGVVAGQWYKLHAVINAAATSISFYIDDVLVATSTTNIPNNSTVSSMALLDVVKTAGTTERQFYIDAWYHTVTLTTPVL